MKLFKRFEDELLTAGFLLFAVILFSSGCKSRKVVKDYEKTQQSSNVKSEIDFKEQFQDKSTFEKWITENNYTVTRVVELYDTSKNIGQSADNSKNRLISRYSETITKGSKQEGSKQQNDLSQNKSLQAKKDSSGTSSHVIKKKVTEAKSAGLTGWFSFGVILVAVGLLTIFWKKVKNLLLGWIFPV